MRVASVLSILLGACSGGGGTGILDAPPPVGCEIPFLLESAVPTRVNASFTGGGGGGGGGGIGPRAYRIDHQLTDDPTYDVITLEMFRGRGAFAGGFEIALPATITLAGAELDSATCGACVRAFGDVHDDTWDGEYFATSGTLELTALTPVKVAGVLRDVTFVHVQEGSVTTIPLNDGCVFTIAELAFDVMAVLALR